MPRAYYATYISHKHKKLNEEIFYFEKNKLKESEKTWINFHINFHFPLQRNTTTTTPLALQGMKP